MPESAHPYIINHLKAGTSETEIKNNLLQSGWTEEAVGRGIARARQVLNEDRQKLPSPSLTTLSSIPGLQIQMPILWLLLIQLALGFEWLVSALNKILSPNYPIEFGKQIATLSTSSPFSTVSTLLRDSILPSYTLFAYLLEYGELFVGLIFLAAALLAVIKKGWEEEVHRILIPGIVAGIIISIFSLITTGLPESPPLAATAPDLFNVLVQVVLLIAYSYLYFV